jgi:hypothetical protein
MNRHERRFAEKFARLALQWPEVRPGEVRRAGVYHLVYRHDQKCPTLNSGRGGDCTCQPEVSVHQQPDLQ